MLSQSVTFQIVYIFGLIFTFLKLKLFGFYFFRTILNNLVHLIAALYTTMRTAVGRSVSQSVRPSVNNKFQGVRNALKEKVMILLQCFMHS
jgi:hypothetical protein